MNNKGQLDKIIITFPIMLLLFILIAIYLFLAGSIFVLNGPSTPAYLESVNLASFGQDIMFREIDIMSKEKVLFFDAYALYEKGEIDASIFFSGIEKMMILDHLDNQCFIFFSGINGVFPKNSIFYAEYHNNEIYIAQDFLNPESKIKVNYPEGVKRNVFSMDNEILSLYVSSMDTKKIKFEGRAGLEEIYIYYGSCLRGQNE